MRGPNGPLFFMNDSMNNEDVEKIFQINQRVARVAMGDRYNKLD